MTHALPESMVKACLFLVVAVAVADGATCAASSPGCPSKMQADANTLLQTGVRIGDELAPGRTDEEEEKNTYTDEATDPHKVSWMQEGMNTQQLKEKLIDNSNGKGRHDTLIQLSRFVNTLGNATKHLNSSNAANLNEIIKILRAVMYKSMTTDHGEDQNELDQAFAGFTTCNTVLAKETTDYVTPRKNTMVSARSTHTTCRSEEALLETIKTQKWDDSEALIAGISTPPSVTTWPASPTYDVLVSYFSTASAGYSEWLVRQKQAFDTKKDAYVSASTNWTTKKSRCDSDQTTFESNFCVYKSVLDVTCLNHDACHTSASSGAIATKARVEGTEAARKDAYKAGEEIVCRINALLANHAYSECDTLTVNTSNYSIVYPTADAKDSCVKEAEEPCSTTWVDTEYNGLAGNAPSTICTPCKTCGPHEKVVDNKCTVCPAGKTSAGDDDVAAEDTTCEATKCGASERVQGNTCVACPAGKTNPAGDDASQGTTSCQACATTKYVSSNACIDCPAGSTCDGTSANPCATTKYVSGNVCRGCPGGSTCDGTSASPCATTKYVSGNVCKGCPAGSTCNGDKATVCEAPKAVDANQCKANRVLLLASTLRTGSLGKFSGAQVGSLETQGSTDYRIGKTGTALNKERFQTIVLETAHGKSMKWEGPFDFSKLNNIATGCNARSISELKPGLWWHAGGSGCFGSTHFGFSTTNDVHSICTQHTTKHWGHFHRNNVNKGVYMWGNSCFNKGEDNQPDERFYVYGVH